MPPLRKPVSSKKKINPTRKHLLYNADSMRKAVQAVMDGMPKKEAARKYGVPRTSLLRKANGEVPIDSKLGAPTVLTEAEETLLENFILSSYKRGFPIHRNNIMDSVQKVLKQAGKESMFPNDGRPGLSWFKGFLFRHPKISEKQAETLTKARAAVSKEGIENWFNGVQKYFRVNRVEDILQDPSRIFNADETGFQLCPKSGKVLCARGDRNCYRQVGNNEKEQLTVMCTFSADGKKLPPTIVYPYKRKIPRVIADSIPEGWHTGMSASGWMNSDVFYGYIANFFIPYIKSLKLKLPVVLFVDGYRAHLTLQVSELCRENEIILVAFHPNCTHFLQPADVSVFGPLKQNWKNTVRDWQFENYPQVVTRQSFAKLLKHAMDKVTEESVQNGFRACGIFPFSSNSIDFQKVIKCRQIENPFEESVQQEKEQSVPVIKATDALKKMESHMDEERLAMFIEVFETKNEWFEMTEPEEIVAKELYEVWRGLKNEAEGEDAECKVKTVESRHLNPEDLDLVDEAMNLDGPDPTDLELDLDNAIIITVPSNDDITPEMNIDFNEVEIIQDCGPSTESETHPPSLKHRKSFSILSPFKTCLLWPGENEGPSQPNIKVGHKRKLFPSVVSGEKWRERYKMEEEEKFKKTREKEERKNKRKKKTVTDDDWVCRKCSASWNEEDKKRLGLKWVNCDMCGAAFHLKCIPKTYRADFGLDSDSEDEDINFTCHLCAPDEEDIY